MAEHTPEPWHICKAGPDRLIYAGPQSRDLAIVRGAGTDAETDANATVMAAAPKMLAALRRLYNDADDRDETRDEETGELFDDWAAALEAINEATGTA